MERRQPECAHCPAIQIFPALGKEWFWEIRI